MSSKFNPLNKMKEIYPLQTLFFTFKITSLHWWLVFSPPVTSHQYSAVSCTCSSPLFLVPRGCGWSSTVNSHINNTTWSAYFYVNDVSSSPPYSAVCVHTLLATHLDYSRLFGLSHRMNQRFTHRFILKTCWMHSSIQSHHHPHPAASGFPPLYFGLFSFIWNKC